jgi:hypothetical protein
MFFFFTCGTHGTSTKSLSRFPHISRSIKLTPLLHSSLQLTSQRRRTHNRPMSKLQQLFRPGTHSSPIPILHPSSPQPLFPIALPIQLTPYQVTKRWEWFTFCFVPLIPFSLKPRQEVRCHICNFGQDIKYQPDVQAQIAGNNGGGQGQGVMMHGGQDGAMGTHANGQGQVPMGVPPQYK